MAESGNEDRVYRQLSADMRDGLRSIYQQISTASQDGGAAAQTADALFTEASDQLAEVVRTTESATMQIMELVETHQSLASECAAILDKLQTSAENMPALERLRQINAKLSRDLITVLTTLSFQDLTGQRIKKVVATLDSIERSVVDLYVSSGLVMDAAEKNPERDAGQIRAEARQAVEDFRQRPQGGSELKGPDKNGISQSAIDDMLAQLGL